MEKKEKIESAILVLEDIKKALESEEPLENCISRWEKAKYIAPEVTDIRGLVRAAYVEDVGFAISVLKAVASITESAGWLQSIRWRIVEYDKNMPYYPDDYKEQLIKADTAAVDSFISVLKSLE